MNLNWKSIVMGFIITLILYVIGASLGYISILKGLIYVLAPIIGGFVVIYLNDMDYVSNIVNGGLAGGIAGFTAVFISSGLIEPVPVFGANLELVVVIILIDSIMAFVIGTVLGLIGGTLGILIKGHGFKKESLA